MRFDIINGGDRGGLHGARSFYGRGNLCRQGPRPCQLEYRGGSKDRWTGQKQHYQC